MSDLEAAGVDASAAAAAAGAATPSITFKKKGAKRKEFRAPAASLASRTDAALQQTNQHAQPAAAAAAGEPAPAPAPAVTVEDETSNDDAAPASAASASAAAASIAAASDSDSDSDDDGAPRRSIALSAADAAAAAAAIEEEEPEDANDDTASGVQRPMKRAKRENPLVQSTRNKLKKDANLNIQSTRSVLPDSRTADKQITMDVSSAKVVRDEKKPKWSGPTKPQAANDYKETGRCGYGDSCKFMHDRGDYKAGWQLEREWAAEQEEKRKRMLQGLSGDGAEENFEIKADESLPWACGICREPFVNPVVTRCKHYFCEKCALDHYVKDTKCADCRAQTGGIFNTATEIISVMKRRAATGDDPRAKLEALEQERIAEKARNSGWAIP